MSAGKVLIVLSDAHEHPIKKDGGTVGSPTGVFLMELAKPLDRLLSAGYEVTFASPEGKQPGIDPLSESTPLAFLGNWKEKERENELVKSRFNNPRPFRDITDEELRSFDGVFIPGGHAPLTDLGDNAELGRILLHFHENAKPTGAICHGPYAFLSTKHAPNSSGFAYKGYKITSWSDTEEKVVEVVKGGEIPKVESALREEGADMVEGIGKSTGDITLDREVVSAANPTGAAALGDKFVEMLGARKNGVQT